MRHDPTAYVLDGAAARLNPGIGRSLATGPGQLGRAGAAGVVVWNASTDIVPQDLIAGFWRDEAGQIDWLTGYLCDAETIEVFEVLGQPERPFDEPEELYSRASMNTLESDPQAEYP